MAKKVSVLEELIGVEAVIHCIQALSPYGIELREYLRSAMVRLLDTTDEARTDLVNDAIQYAKIKNVEVRKKTFEGIRPNIERIQVDVRAPEAN